VLSDEATITGKLIFHNTRMYVGSYETHFPVVTFENDVVAEACRIAPYGTAIFKGRLSISAEKLYLGFMASAKGLAEFHCSSNVAPVVATYKADISFKAKDAFADSLLYFEYDSDTTDLLLNGYDQTFKGIAWATMPRNRPEASETSKRFRLISDAPSTLRITGFLKSELPSTTEDNVSYRASLTNEVALSGKVSLLMDVGRQYREDGFFQQFSTRRSDTTGDLIISSGDFRVSDGASFPNVPNIHVGVNGIFDSTTGKAGAFAGCTNLTVLGKASFTCNASPFGYRTMSISLASDSELWLDEDATVTVKELVVDGVAMKRGIYGKGEGKTELPQLKSGTVVVRTPDIYVDLSKGAAGNSGSADSPVKTIGAALEVADAGDTVHVAPGVYDGAVEPARKATDECMVFSRIVIPEGVTVASTHGAEHTFIVGAPATGDQIDNATYGTGTNATRCVYAHNGAKLKGFTLTGGRVVGVREEAILNDSGSAFYVKSGNLATVEDCIVTNNIGHRRTIMHTVVRRCHVLENRGLAAYDCNAGAYCYWYNSIIDNNAGSCTIYNPHAIENCTIGGNNKLSDRKRCLYWSSDIKRNVSVLNSVILDERRSMGNEGYKICFTNCLLKAKDGAGTYDKGYNTTYTNEVLGLDAEYRPTLGLYAGIDVGAKAYKSTESGETDILGTPRILNGELDIGAVEYDWRGLYSQSLGRQFVLTDVSSDVSLQEDGELAIADGYISGAVKSDSVYRLVFTLNGGRLQVYSGDVLLGESVADGEQSLRFAMPEGSVSLRIVFEPNEDSGAAVLKTLSLSLGTVISIR
jgi:hypothetical protein